jgi:hypothetical protein
MDYLGKEEMLTNRDVTKREKLSVHMEHFWDLLFHLMKHETLHFCSVCIAIC